MEKLEGLKRKPTHVHEVAKDSNLDLILRGTNGAVNKLADAILNGAKVLALALSTPTDNSAAVQAEIDKLVAQLDVGTADIKNAIDQQTKEN